MYYTYYFNLIYIDFIFIFILSIVDEILDEKIKIFSQINLLFNTLDDEMDEMDDNIEVVYNWYIHFNDMITKTWTKLMSKEVVIHDQLVVCITYQ